MTVVNLPTLVLSVGQKLTCQYMTGFLSGGHFSPPWLWFVPPWICWEFCFTCKSIIKALMIATMNGKLCLCENSPRFHQIAPNKMSKIKISQRSMPPDPSSLPHALHTDTYFPPNNPYNLILPHLGQSWKKTCMILTQLCKCGSRIVLFDHEDKGTYCLWFNKLNALRYLTLEPSGINVLHFYF